MLLLALNYFIITNNNLRFFILDNTTNNNITLTELSKSIDFDPVEQRLRYIGYILNLIAKQYLFGQDAASFKKDFKAIGALGRQKL